MRPPARTRLGLALLVHCFQREAHNPIACRLVLSRSAPPSASVLRRKQIGEGTQMQPKSNSNTMSNNGTDDSEFLEAVSSAGKFEHFDPGVTPRFPVRTPNTCVTPRHVAAGATAAASPSMHIPQLRSRSRSPEVTHARPETTGSQAAPVPSGILLSLHKIESLEEPQRPLQLASAANACDIFGINAIRDPARRRRILEQLNLPVDAPLLDTTASGGARPVPMLDPTL